MTGRKSAGILVYRRGAHAIEVLLVHPGGPFWRRKDAGAWMIPKGEIAAGEAPLAAALREFAEETGVALSGAFVPLGNLRQAGGKSVTVFAVCAELDPATIKSNMFELEWPPKSGRRAQFPEIDRAEWCELAAAHTKILASQRPFLQRLAAAIGETAPQDVP